MAPYHSNQVITSSLTLTLLLPSYKIPCYYTEPTLIISWNYDPCLLRNLYASQEATVRIRHGKIDWFQIGKGVCQGCILSPCLFNLYVPASESFPMSQLFAWGGQSTGVSALASFLPNKSQGWSPSEWTGWISLQSKGLSRVFSNTTVQNHQFFVVLSFLHSPTLTSVHDHWKNHSLD